MAGLLADGLNLGLTRMAEACSIASLGQLAWTADWHIREETYALALRRLVNQQQREPFAAHIRQRHRLVIGRPVLPGGGLRSRCGAAERALRPAARLQGLHAPLGSLRPFYTKLIAATASEALHVLGRAALSSERGRAAAAPHRWRRRFRPCLRALRPAWLSVRAAHPGPQAPSALQLRQAVRLSHAGTDDRRARSTSPCIRAHWSEILRVVASIRTGTVTASLIMRQLAAYPRQNGVAAALRELGRLERTLFTLDWISDPELRRGTGQELNKGEARNSLARAVFIHRLGEIRDRTYENQQHRASGLNLLVTAIILWNTRYLERAVAALRTDRGCAGPSARPSLAARLGARQPDRRLRLGRSSSSVSENPDGLRPLRLNPTPSRQPPDVPALSAYAYQRPVR